MQQHNLWQVPRKRIIENFEAWKSVYDIKEPGFVLFYPYTDHSYRAKNYLDWLTTRHQPKPRLITIYPTWPGSEDISVFDLTENDKKTGILIDSAELLFTPDTIRLLYELLNYSKLNLVPMLFLTEMQPVELDRFLAKSNETAFTKNIINYPLYTKKEIFVFLQFLEKNWNFKLPKSMYEPIFEETGGHLWLVKEIARQVRKEKKVLSEIVNSEAYIYRSSMIWQRLPEEVKYEALNYYRTKKPINFKLNRHLTKTNFFNPECENKLPKYLTRLIKDKYESKIETRDHSIYLNGKEITIHFSQHEKRMLNLLLSRKNSLVSRDELAKARWGNNWADLYSDWAIDQSLYRLRNKLNKLDSTIIIKSLRKKGYGIYW